MNEGKIEKAEEVRIWDYFPELARIVKVLHFEFGLTASGHYLDHDLEVAQLAYIVAKDQNEDDAILAGAAGLLHSIDRIIEKKLRMGKSTVSEVSE